MPELIDVVNEQDVVIGVMDREDPLHVHHISRNVVVSLRNSKGEHIIQVRAKDKKHWPGCFDLAACGGVKSGESYVQAAERELFEEIGVRCELRPVLKYLREVAYKGGARKHFTQLFVGTCTGSFEKTDEVDEVLTLSSEEIIRLIESKDPRVQPFFIEEFGKFAAYWD